MIVADTNLIAQIILGGNGVDAAREVYRIDHRWSAPVLWRSEFLSVLAQSLRREELTGATAEEAYRLAEELLGGNEYFVPAARVLRLVAASPCSAYDCEFAALAQILGVSLVTSDKQVLRAFPGMAISPDRFVGSRG